MCENLDYLTACAELCRLSTDTQAVTINHREGFEVVQDNIVLENSVFFLIITMNSL
jgi:hypothetical protein